jgi:fructose-bisphosphate aldolase class I
MYDETIRQAAADGTPFPELLTRQGIVPGIKVDAGAHALAGAPGETVTEGLDGLRARLAEYHRLGARFTKWRAVISIGDGRPSAACLRVNAHALARYAALSQEAGLVPIVEPEVLMDGDHTLERCFEVTAAAHQLVFEELAAQRVQLEGMLLKPNMVVAGQDAPRPGIEQVAEATVRLLRRTVPPAVPGIAFLSGGQTEQEATAHLNAMNRIGPHPWPLTFSYGRALQASVIKAWGGRAEQRELAQRVYAHRARCNGLATLGQYSEDLERELTLA